MRVIEQPPYQRPTVPAIPGPKKPRRLHAAIKMIRLILEPRRDLPDLLERLPGILRKLDGMALGVGPFLPEIVGGAQRGPKSPMKRGKPDAAASRAPVISQRVDHVPWKMRPGHLPPLPPSVGAQQESPLGGPHQHDCIAAL